MAAAPPPPLSFLTDEPTTLGSQQEPSCVEEQLAELVAAVANNDIPVGAAIQQLGSLSKEEAQAARHRGHSTAKSWLLETTATEQAAQGDTWSLLHHLHCADSPVRQGGGAPRGTGMLAEAATYRQSLADLIPQHEGLDRCARVVAWLEHMAAQQLTEQPSAGFAAGEGLPISTLARADGTAVDPDAGCREGAQLSAADVKNNDRILHHVWKLLRAGRFQDAVQLAGQVGQSWRAAGLLGGGPLGALPVGAAAELQNGVGVGQVYEELAAELEHGVATPSTAWKWSCWQASTRGDASHLGWRHERAVYGALCGNLEAMLPACSTWEDAAWAHCRAWLDVHSHRALLHASDSLHSDTPEVSVEEVVSALQRVAAGPLEPQVVAQAMRLGQPDSWPPPELLEGLAGGLDEVFAESLPSLQDKPAIQQACAAKYHQLQVQLILQQHTALTGGELVDALQEEGGPWQLPPPYAPGAGTTRQYMLLRFGAHLALMMRALGVAYELVEVAGSSVMDADGDADEGAGQLQTVQHFQAVAEATDKLLVLYCAHLMEGGLQHLVPHYALHCSTYHRSRVLQQLLAATTFKALEAAATAELLELEAALDAACHKVWSVLAAACTAAQQRQAAASEVADGQASDQLPTQLRPDELEGLLLQVAHASTSSSSSSPVWRTRLHRWLFYPYFDHRQAPADPLPPTESPATAAYSLPVAQTLHLACVLACSLHDPHSQAAADLLWQHVVPPEYTQWTASEVEAWAEAAAQHEAAEEEDAFRVEQALGAAAAVRDQVEELHRLLLLLRHATAARDWLQASDSRERQEEGRGLLDEALDLLEGSRDLLQPSRELLDSQTVPPFLRLWLTSSAGGAPLDPLARTLPSLQGAAVSQLEERVAAVVAAWQSSNADGAGNLLASRLSLHTEEEGAATQLLLELEAQDSSLQALEQLLLLPAVLLGGSLEGSSTAGTLLLAKLEGTPQLDVLLAERILAGQLLLEAQRLRLRLLDDDATADPAAGLAERLAEPSTALGEVAECLPREVLQQFLLMEAEVDLLALRAEEAR